VSGSTGCNRFAGTSTQHGAKLRIQLGPVTKAACPDVRLEAQERRILAALPRVRSVRRSGDRLTLLDSDGADLLSYSKVSGELAGTSWKVTGVNRNGGVETSALTEALTLELGTHGEISGSGGCNRFTGTFTQHGTSVRITPAATTMVGCEQDVMAMETDYLAALGRVTDARVSGTTLELRDATGAMQVTLRSAARSRP
jgi:heat shock protein HslJ